MLFALAALRSLPAVDSQAVDDLLLSIPVRQAQSLQAQFDDTFPRIGSNSGSSIIMWNRINFAIAAYWRNQDIAVADAGLISLLNDSVEFTDPINGDPYYKTAYQDDVDRDHFHWNGYLLARIYFLFSSNSTYFPGRMSAVAEDAVLQMLWDWLATQCRLEYADPANVHISWGSENHHAQQWVGFWSACQIFKDLPAYQNQLFADGSTPIQNAVGFDAFFKAYCRERSLKGGTVEVASPTYAKYTLNTWLNLYDFADDPLLKQAADRLIDIYWADWAIEQLDGQHGGSRHRNYPGSPTITGNGAAGHSWILFGLGQEIPKHPGDMSAISTFWRPSRATIALVLGSDELGTYQYKSRRLGVRDPNPPPLPTELLSHSWNPLDPDGGSLFRTTWRTPSFVMGMSQVGLLEANEWIAFSSQNRWNGVIFRGQPETRIFTQRPYPGTPDRAASETNAEWGVQNKGAMILQRITKHTNANGQAVWFDFDLSVSEINGWIFAVAADAYAAVRIVDSEWDWVPDSDKYHRGGNENLNLGQWAELIDQYSPIIIEVGRKSDYAGYSAFRNEILSNPLAWNGSQLDYTSTHYGTTLTLFADESAPPRIDGIPVDLSPVKNYDSPYLKGDFAGGPVMITYGEERTVHAVAPFADDAHTFGLWHFDALVSDTIFEDDTSVTGRAPADVNVHPDSVNSISVIPDGPFGSAIRCAFEPGDQYLITLTRSWPPDLGTIRYQGWIRMNSGDTGGALFHIYDQVLLEVSPTELSLKVNLSGEVLDSSATNEITLTAAIESSNGWQYIEAIYDGAHIRLITGEETVSAPGIGPFVPNVSTIHIGSRKNRSNYVGDIADVKVSAFLPDEVLVSASAENFQKSNPNIVSNTITGFAPVVTANSKLVVAASWEQGTAGIANITYSGLPLLEAITSSAGRQSSIWYLDLNETSPSLGDVVVTFNAPTDSRIGVISLLNATVGAPAQVFAAARTATMTLDQLNSNSLTIGVYTENNNGMLTSDFENTLYSGDSGSSVGHAGYQLQASPGIYNYSWSDNDDASAIAAVIFEPAPLILPAPVDDDADGMDDEWEMEYFGNLGRSDGSTDSDKNGFTDLQEFKAGSDPLDAASLFEISGLTGQSISWKAVQGKTYRVWASTDLSEANPWSIQASGIAGTPPESTYYFLPILPKQFFKIEVE